MIKTVDESAGSLLFMQIQIISQLLRVVALQSASKQALSVGITNVTSGLWVGLLCACLLLASGCGGSGSSGSNDRNVDSDRETEEPVDPPVETPDGDEEPEDTPQPDEPQPDDPEPDLISPEALFLETDTGRVGPGRILDPTVRIIGRANPFDTVIVYVSETGSGSVQANAEGVWDLDFRPFLLAPGSYRIDVSAITLAGETLQAESSFVFIYDPFPPSRPTITGISNDSGVAGDGITNNGDQIVQGSSEPGYTINLFLDGEPVGSTETDSDGLWRFDLGSARSALPEGSYAITATSLDFGLESTLTDPFLLVVDQLPPQQTQLLPRPGSTSVAQSPLLQLQFPEPVFINGGSVRIRRAEDDAVVANIPLDSPAVSGNGTSSIDVAVSAQLAFSTEYYVELSGGALRDLAGNLSALLGGRQAWSFTVEQPAFAPINVTSLGANEGYTVTGIPSARLGADVTGIADMNGDGWDEFALGAPGVDSERGAVYVILGSAALSRSNVTLADWSPTEGFLILGAAVGDRLGEAVASAGDLNGDGYGDLMVSAPGADVGGSDAGVVYVVWGRPALSDINVAGWSAANGFRIVGREPGTRLGDSRDDVAGLTGNGQVLAAGGDYNGDGFADLLIGHPLSDAAANGAGAAYLILGRAGVSRGDVDTAALGADGFAIRPTGRSGWKLGQSVTFAYDFNNDGFDDVAVAATGSDLGAANGGAAFLIYGRAGTDFPTLDVNQLGASQGRRWVSSEIDSYLGYGLAAGEFNGDGIADLYIGQPGKDHDGMQNAGAVHVIFGGTSQPFSTDVDLLPAAAGFSLFGADTDDHVGHGLAGAGDINADGLDDLVIGAYNARYAGARSGRAWVVLGSEDATIPSWNLQDFLSTDGIPLRGDAGGDRLGQSLSAADHNGDGFNDVILGAPGYSGEAGLGTIVWGNDWLGDVVFLNGQGGEDNIVGSAANDVLVGNGGRDAYSAGAGNDRIETPDADFFRLNGGNGEDTLTLTGSNVELDLTQLPRETVNSIEVIDLGDSNNLLRVSRQRVLKLSSHTNTLRVAGGSSDRFETATGDNWNRVGDVSLNGITYVHYADGEAEVLVQDSIIQPGVERLLSSQRYYLDTTEDGASVRGNVDNFPLLVRISDAAIIDAVQPGAPDIRFVDDDGTTRLPYEIERWDQATNEALVWVLVPTVNGNSNSDFITMLYDDAVDGTVADGQDPATLWNDYSGVWHFAETDSARDSSPFANHGVDVNGVGRTESFVGRGATFTNDDAYRVPYAPSMNSAGGAFSVEAWYTSDTCSISLLGRLSLSLLGRNDGSGGFWQLNSAQYVASVIPIVGSRVDRASFALGEGSSDSNLSGGSLIGVFLGDCMEHVVATYDPIVGAQIYINGSLRDTDDGRYNLASSADLIIGGHGTNYDLTLDEARMARRMWDADRIRLTHQNQIEDSGLVIAE